MAVIYDYPTNAELTEIDPVLLAAELVNDPLLGPGGLFPMEETDADKVVWEQRDAYLGLAQFRGLNGDPPRVKRIGAKRYEMNPGVYGEFTTVDEYEMTRRAQPATWATPVNVDDLVMDCEEQLMTRQTNRMRQVTYALLTQGIFTVLDANGSVVHQDAYNINIYTPSVSIALPATATPLADLRAIPILARGTSSLAGAGAELWVNQVTANQILAVTNTADLRGERLDNDRTAQSISDVNLIFTRNGLPNIRIVEDGYYTDAGVWTMYIPDGTGVYVGRRANGAPLGAFRLTKNASAPSGRGVYAKVIPRGMSEDSPPPAKIEVHRGFNGGTVIWYPGSVFIIRWY